jgi:hypothetical protein
MAERGEDTPYKLTLKGPGHTLDRAVDEATALQIVSLVMGGSAGGLDKGTELGASSSLKHTGPPSGADGASTSTPKAFMATKRPQSDVQRITCLAYYLTHHRDTTAFKTRDLTALNTEAAQSSFSNSAYAVTNAVNQQYLSAAGGGNKQITVRGEALVDALPDQSKVKDALANAPGRKRRKASAKRGRTKAATK